MLKRVRARRRAAEAALRDSERRHRIALQHLPGTSVGLYDLDLRCLLLEGPHLELAGIAPSIGTVGDAYDNALMESIIGLFKTEAITTTVFHAGPYKTLADVEYVAAGWVDWYNHRRLHGSLGMLTPIEYEQDYYAALSREPQPV